MRASTFFRGVVLGAVTSTLVLVVASAIAGTGVGAVFNLGETNSVDATSMLQGSTAGPMLQITNASADTGATALGLNVTPGKPPFTVNSDAKVTGLNADALDGLDSSDFVQGGGSVRSARAVVNTQAAFVPFMKLPGLLDVDVGCVAFEIPPSYGVSLTNTSGGTLDTFVEPSGETPSFDSVADGSSLTRSFITNGPARLIVQVSRAPRGRGVGAGGARVGTMILMVKPTVLPVPTCLFQAQAVQQP